MPTANEKVTDRMIRHQVLLLQYADGVADSLSAKLNASRTDVRKAILNSFVDGELPDVKVARGRRHVSELMKEIHAIRGPVWSEIRKSLSGEMQKLTATETKFLIGLLESELPLAEKLSVPSKNKLANIVDGVPFQGRVLESWLLGLEAADSRRIEAAIKSSLIQNASASEIATNVIGSRALKYKDGALRKAVTGAEAIAHTAIPTVRQEVSREVLAKNAFLVKQEYFLATLDASTTLLCAGNDGEVFDLHKGPVPPLHFRCRSLRLPHLSPESIADRPFNPTTERGLVRDFRRKNNLRPSSNYKTLPRGYKTQYQQYARKRKREMIGAVPEKQTYSQWLTNQSTEFQDDILGPSRAQLFRSGKVKIDKFISNGRRLTLDELEARF